MVFLDRNGASLYNPGDVCKFDINVGETAQFQGSQLSGTLITSDKRIAVFSGMLLLLAHRGTCRRVIGLPGLVPRDWVWVPYYWTGLHDPRLGVCGIKASRILGDNSMVFQWSAATYPPLELAQHHACTDVDDVIFFGLFQVMSEPASRELPEIIW